MIRWELKKIIKSKSSIAISLIFALLILSASFMKPTLEIENSHIDEKGNYIQDNRDKIVIANEKLDEKVNSLKYISNKENINSEDDFTKKIGIMSKEKLKADNGDKYEDIIFYQVFNYRINNIISSFLITAIIIIIFSNIYTDEKLSNVDSVILSSQNKNKVLYSKLVLSIMVPILVYLLYIVIIGFITAIQYGSPINGNLQAYRISDIPFMLKNSININEYIIINIVTMMIIFTTISVFSSLSSFVANNSVEAVVGSTIFVILGKVLTLIKFLPKEILQVLSDSNYIDIFHHLLLIFFFLL